MPKPLSLYNQAQCEAMFELARNERLGYLVGSYPDAMRGRAMLYEARRDRPEYSNFQIRFSPDNPDTELWILNNQTNWEQADETAPYSRSNSYRSNSASARGD